MSFTVASSLLFALFASTVFAAPAPSLPKRQGFIANSTTITALPTATVSTHQSGGQEYVVLFNSSQPEPAYVADILQRLDLSPEHSDVRYTFNNSAFRGFVANMKSHCIDALNNMTEVAAVEQSVSIMSLATARQGSPWGLQRISSSAAMSGNEKNMAFTYSYDDAKLGSGVDIYVVDTGINTAHTVFDKRATMGFSFQQDNTDGDGHGTHVSGTAAGTVFGVSSGANLIGVKVLGADGSGLSSDTIAGMNWAINNHEQRKNQPGFVGSILSMSWALSGDSPAITQAIQAATNAGIHVSVAAGNNGQNSCSFSPSNSGGANGPAVTVGSIGIDNTISSFSNTGSCNDVYAPGENILSAWKDSPTTVNYLSGTSMACPHVTGVMAYLMAEDSSLAQNPAALKQKIRDMALKGAVKGSAGKGDPMLLVNNGIGGNIKRDAKLSDWTLSDDDTSISRRGVSPSGVNSIASWVGDLLGKKDHAKRWLVVEGETQLRV